MKKHIQSANLADLAKFIPLPTELLLLSESSLISLFFTVGVILFRRFSSSRNSVSEIQKMHSQN